MCAPPRLPASGLSAYQTTCFATRLVQAAQLTKVLHEAGVPCASGLCVPAGDDWET